MTEATMQEMGRRILALRESRAWTRPVMARKFSAFTPDGIRRWELAERFPNRRSLLALARAFRMSIPELLRGIPDLPTRASELLAERS